MGAADSSESGAGPTVELLPWRGPWAAEDPNANFKADVAQLADLDPMETLRGLSRSTGIPEGALARYVLARWASSGSAGLLEVGPSMVEQLHAVTEAAEAVGTDAARLSAYRKLRAMLSWLRAPLDGRPAEPGRD